MMMQRYGMHPRQWPLPPLLPPLPLLVFPLTNRWRCSSCSCALLIKRSCSLSTLLVRKSMSVTSQMGLCSSHSIVGALVQLLGRGTGMMLNKFARRTISFTYSLLRGRKKVFGRREHGSRSNENRDLLFWFIKPILSRNSTFLSFPDSMYSCWHKLLPSSDGITPSSAATASSASETSSMMLSGWSELVIVMNHIELCMSLCWKHHNSRSVLFYMFISRTIRRRNQNLDKEQLFCMCKQRSLWIQLWNFSNERWKLMRLYRLWNLWTRLKKFRQLGLTSWRKLSPTISEIQVESRIIWLWTLGNLETWIQVCLYGHHLKSSKDE